jgi:hypothetical protein
MHLTGTDATGRIAVTYLRPDVALIFVTCRDAFLDSRKTLSAVVNTTAWSQPVNATFLSRSERIRQ